ncbi:DUF6412 domain-containing protein [Microbacterium sp. RD1]|uniref:DUF6412 domain-containing protein n=1 Tax=Microbacterium sp. RD1 TaxID=3457313 RepID=UPI003FA57658
MIEALLSPLHVLLFAVGLTAAAESGALGLALVILAVAVAAAVAVALATGVAPRRSGAHPRRAIDLSSPLAQSDPDASGHPRPRAPGIAAPAA